MFLSIIIPVYNCERFVANCVSNIAGLDLEDYEIILIDDGSTDQTPEVCDNLAYRYDCVQCFHCDNQGASGARNYGIDKANGDYLMFVDADDTIDTDMLTKLLSDIKDNLNIDLAIYGLSFDYYQKGAIYRQDYKVPGLHGICDRFEWLENIAALFADNALSPVWNKVIRRDILVKNSLYLDQGMFIYEDLEYSLRIMNRANKILFVPEAIYHYRQAEDEGNASRRLRRVSSLVDIIDNIHKAFSQYPESHSNCILKAQFTTIELQLYLILAREKINVSGMSEIASICEDFTNWYKRENIDSASAQFVNALLNHKVLYLYLNSRCSRIRHKTAVLIKSSFSSVRRK